MLVLTRKLGESVVLGDGITVSVSQISGNRVRLCFNAPSSCVIKRGELTDHSQAEFELAGESRREAVAAH